MSTKQVFTDPAQVAHLWAHASQDWARYRDNFYFQGAAIYSYGEHFLCGYRLAPGVFALNASSYGVTTSRHQGEVRGATYGDSYYLPELTDLHGRRYSDSPIVAIANHLGKPGAAIRLADDIKRTRPHFESWLRSNFADCDDSALAFLFKGLGYTAKQADSILTGHRKAADAAAAKRKAEKQAEQLDNARALAKLSDSEFWQLLADNPDSQDKELKALRRAHRAASAAGLKGAKVKLWARVQELDSWLTKRPRIERAMVRQQTAESIRQWRAAGKPGDSDSLPYGLDYAYSARYKMVRADKKLPATLRAIEKAKREADAAAIRERFAAWQATGEKRPGKNDWQEGTPERAAIMDSIRTDAAAHIARLSEWLMDGNASSDSAPPASYSGRYELSDSESDKALRDHGEQLARIAFAVTNHRKARDTEAKQARQRAEWLAGTGHRHARYSDSRGGALLRINGNTLETSHGADVPLTHAIRAFPYIKGCREAGQGWKRNGQQIRVGHFQLDSIDSAGNFIAGCHNISWPEVLRVATEAGVADKPGIAPKRTHNGPRDLADVVADNNAHGNAGGHWG